MILLTRDIANGAQSVTWGRRFVFRCLELVFICSLCVNGHYETALAQQPNQWTPQQTIPGYHPETDPPYLIADGNKTVHAFSSQWIGAEEDQAVKAIVYNHWSLDKGWSTPIDIMLSPVKEARIMGAFLDQTGIMHIIFYGGDETEAHIYYTRAPALQAGQAQAWSPPSLIGEAANNPSVAELAGDDQGRLLVIYSGIAEGSGLYTLYSIDRGDSWTAPEPTFPIYNELLPVILNLYHGPSGLLHAVWDLRNIGGQGRQIHYAHLNFDNWAWSEPVILAEVESGYGVLIPTVIEHKNEVVVAYSGVTIHRSGDGGQTWSDPISPFRQTGINGIMSFVKDSNDNLRLLWAQRITGSPDIHGVWHSLWRDGRWTEPVAVVSGPSIQDMTGDQAFDPYDVRAVVSQGNALLITWRSDPGLKGNGVWHSYSMIDAPELPIVPVPTVEPTATPRPTVVAKSITASSTATVQGVSTRPARTLSVKQQQSNNPVGALVAALVPVVLLMVGMILQIHRIRGRQAK